MDGIAGREARRQPLDGGAIAPLLTSAERVGTDRVQTVGDRIRAVLLAKVSDQNPAMVRQVIAAWEQAVAAQPPPGAREG
jgi:hypothetical protein